MSTDPNVVEMKYQNSGISESSTGLPKHQCSDRNPALYPNVRNFIDDAALQSFTRIEKGHSLE